MPGGAVAKAASGTSFMCAAAHAFVGAGAVVNRDMKPFALMTRVPARETGWMSRFGDRIPLPLSGSGMRVSSHWKRVSAMG